MTDLSETAGATSGGKAGCRVAYTINNAQPVSCTIIGAQPMFYLDFGGSADEEAMEGTETSLLENEISALQKELKTLERFTEEFAQDDYQKKLDLREDIGFITGLEEDLWWTQSEAEREAEIPAGPYPHDFMNVLAQSRSGKFYLDHALQHGVVFNMSGHCPEAQYDRRSNQIFVNPSLNLVDQILLGARELRRHWQFRQGALLHPLGFAPDQAVLINRAQSADLATSMVRIAWELQLGGYKKAWMKIENSPLADLGRALAREAFLDFRTLNNGQAAAAVFEAWFLSDRCRAEDKKLIKQMLSDYPAYLGVEAEAAKAMTAQILSALGNMPFGKNYLAAHIRTIMSDPVFTEVRDRSNANFLWFIKFERSFRETERDLQSEFDLAAVGVRQRPSQIKSQDDQTHERANSSVVALFPHAPQSQDTPAESGQKLRPRKRGGSSPQGKTGGNVVYLRRWSGE